MENNMDQNANPAAGQGTGEKTFSQDDVNRIVQERLAKERAKTDNNAELTKREQELEQRELRMSAKEMLSDKGLPTQLLDALNCADKETLEKSIGIMETVFNEFKANATKQHMKPSGVTPAGSNASKSSEDMDIRRIMGLRT